MGKKLKKKIKYPLYISYEEHTRGGGRIPEEEGGDGWECYDSYTDFKVTTASREKPDNCYHTLVYVESEPKKGDHVIVVVVRYSTGSTFGRDEGCGEIVDASTDLKTAQAIADSYSDGKYPGGYFDRFEGTETHVMVVW